MSEAKERPILFSGPMVRAILAGRKTQTRRVVNPQPNSMLWNTVVFRGYGGWTDEHGRPRPCPYGKSGDRLWVRETYNPGLKPERSRADGYLGCVYRADDFSARYSGWWTPSIFMLRRHSRITLEIVSVRVERLQEITDDDAKAEGVQGIGAFRELFSVLWDDINAKRGYSWANNPLVWVIEFRNTSGVGFNASQQPHAVDLASAPLRPNH